MIQQGKRRRHPGHVLHSFAGIAASTEHAKNNWEQALQYENRRIEMPEEFTPTTETEQVVTQMGVVQTALANWKQSKQKLSTMYVAAV